MEPDPTNAAEMNVFFLRTRFRKQMLFVVSQIPTLPRLFVKALCFFQNATTLQLPSTVAV